MLGLFHGEKGARNFRKILTEGMYSGYSKDLLSKAIQEISNDSLDIVSSNAYLYKSGS
ncbi:hypothetical protein LEP1GSC109_0093 [Leptospira interrogans str. UI 13372]|nr:hypothetical protein LEP1GSC109_0093 [Leptospira interrogans str. UI 13372]